MTALYGTDKEALFSVRNLNTQTSKSELLLNYLAASRNAMQVEKSNYRRMLEEEGLVSDEDILKHIRVRRYDRKLESVILDQLEKAFRLEASIK